MQPRFLVAFLVSSVCLSSFNPADAQEIPHFPIREFQVEGNRLLSNNAVQAAIAPYVGIRRSFADVQLALEALEAAYKARGYTTVSVQLPEQVLESGVVRLRVVEGRIKEVRITGQQHFDEENLRATMPTLQSGQPPIVDDVSANLRVANENPAKKLALQLKPGKEEADIDAEIRVTDERPWKIGLSLDNTGTRNDTGTKRLGLSLQHANLWNLDHVLTFQHITSPDHPRDVGVFALSYRMPLYGLGDTLDFFATKSDVDSGTLTFPNSTIALGISGRGSSQGARYTLNLKRQGNYEHSLVFGLDEKDYTSDISAAGVPLGSEITIRPLSLQYNGRWQSEATSLSFNGSLSHNLPGGKNGRQDDFSAQITGAPARFSVLRGGFNASHAYASDWQVQVRGQAQWTDQELVPQEQFGIGGANSVRGFEEREVANDRGLQASLELYTPELCQSLGDSHRCRALAFYDAGAVFRVKPLATDQRRDSISSTGFGLRYAWDKDVAFQADYGHVLGGGGGQKRGDWRWHVRIGVFF
jgi:hemolysin activation/secretion protein